jgi:hypothetical protein
LDAVGLSDLAQVKFSPYRTKCPFISGLSIINCNIVIERRD